jgi:uncharacterized protein YwgA
MSKAAVDWARYALLVELARELGDQQAFGKKALQKVVYLLQEVAGIRLGMRFRFYTYGVFSDDLASTLDAVESLGGVVAQYDRAQNTYQLRSGETADQILKRGSNFLNAHRDQIEEIMGFARGKTAKTLELVSTIVHVARTEQLGAPEDEGTLVESVYELKPKFDPPTIRRQIVELRNFDNLPWLSV